MRITLAKTGEESPDTIKKVASNGCWMSRTFGTK